MKNLSYLLFVIIGANTHLIAQSTLTNTKGLVVYNQILVFDTLTGLTGTETESFLFFDTEKKQSVYAWDRKSKSRHQQVVEANGKFHVKIKNGGVDPIGGIVFKNYQNNNIVERKLGAIIKIVSDSFNINWQISAESKTIQDMVLQKAECDFRGRHYIAWFNPKIPIPDGPWKLRGLPGLILEAYDEKKHVQFNFTSLTLPAEFSEKIEAPTEGVHMVYDCKQFTTDHYKLVNEDTKRTIAKVEQLGGTVPEGRSGIFTNIIERCY